MYRDEFFSDVLNTVTKLFTSLGVGMIACMPFVFPILINAKYNEAFTYIPILVLGSVFNVSICLYTGIYIAKKMTKQVAFTTIMGAVINIVINFLFVKRFGLYAASASTALSYFIMMIYRHFDLKKYVNIKYDKGLLIKSLFIFSFSIFLYYQRNIILNIINLVVVVIYAVILNKNFLISTKNSILKKLGKG